MGCIDAKKISPDCPSGNFQENMHSLRKVYLCVEKLTFSIHLNPPLYEYVWQSTTDSRGRRGAVPGGWLGSAPVPVLGALPAAQAAGRAPRSRLVRCDPFSRPARRPRRRRRSAEQQQSSAAGAALSEPSVDLAVFVRLRPHPHRLACHKGPTGLVDFSLLPLITIF